MQDSVAFKNTGRPLAARGRAKVSARRLGLVALVALVAWPPLAWAAARGLSARAPLERADALAVLGGSAAYAERARKGAELFREGRASLVLLTDDGERGGWSQVEQRNPFFVERAAEELRRGGVPAERIETLPGKVSSTREEALRLRAEAERRGLRSLLVVTSAYHSRRALWTMRKVFEGSGVEVGVEVAGDGEGAHTPSPALWWLESGGWSQVAGEYVKLAYYWARY